MCTECCWCLCIHRVQFRSASFFFASVHNYDTVYKLISLVAKNILFRSYFMESTFSHEIHLDEPLEDASDLVCKFSYYVSSLVTALLIFRGIEKEWRQIIEWSAGIFLMIEAAAFGIQSTFYPASFTTLNFTLMVLGRLMFISFYVVTLALYIRELRIDEKETASEKLWKVEPSYIFRNDGGSSGTTWGNGTLSFISLNGTIPREAQLSLPKFKVGPSSLASNGRNKKLTKFYFPNWGKQESGFYFERFPKV